MENDDEEETYLPVLLPFLVVVMGYIIIYASDRGKDIIYIDYFYIMERVRL